MKARVPLLHREWTCFKSILYNVQLLIMIFNDIQCRNPLGLSLLYIFSHFQQSKPTLLLLCCFMSWEAFIMIQTNLVLFSLYIGLDIHNVFFFFSFFISFFLLDFMFRDNYRKRFLSCQHQFFCPCSLVFSL